MNTPTPMMRQYLDIKNSNKDSILFFRMGDFYEMFFEDAVVASKILGITLTSRDKKKDGGIPMCGIPYHAAASYIPKLLKEGRKVAICEQVEDAKGVKGIVKREVTRIITPGVPLDEALIDAKSNNYLSSVFISNNEKGGGLAFIDVTTGEFRLTEIEKWDEFLSELNKIEPKEVLLSEALKDSSVSTNIHDLMPSLSLTYLDGGLFDSQSAKRYLMEQYEVASLDGFGCSHLNGAVRAAGALLYYIRETQKQRSVHIKPPLSYHNKEFMILDSNTLQNLELVRSVKDGAKRGSLLGVIDKTRTAIGGRKIREALLFPLMDISKIKKRQDAVEALISENRLREDMQEELKEFHDLERIIARLALLRVSPRDLVALKDSLKKVPEIKAILEPFDPVLLREVYTGLEEMSELVHLIEEVITDDPPMSIKDGGFIRDGYNKDLDELKDIKKNSRDWIVGLENREKKRTGITSLKIRYNKVFGYYIEITKTNLSLVPDNYIRR
ncbi:MAG: DNA mismatch repair protein MutS, partial [Thermodesulfobacteriota bacterium]